MITLPFATILSFAVLTTSFVSGIFGMAGGMLLIVILLAILPLAPAMVLHGITQMTANAWRAWIWRDSIGWTIVGYYAVGALLAAIAVALIAFVPDKSVVLVALGLSSLAGLLVPTGLAPKITSPCQAVACGAICTALQLTAGIAGPALDVFFVRTELDRRRIVATKAAVQALGHGLKIAYFGQVLAGGDTALPPIAIMLAIALAILGTQLSRRVLDALSDAQFRGWTRKLIFAIAACCLVEGLIGAGQALASFGSSSGDPVTVANASSPASNASQRSK